MAGAISDFYTAPGRSVYETPGGALGPAAGCLNLLLFRTRKFTHKKPENTTSSAHRKPITNIYDNKYYWLFFDEFCIIVSKMDAFITRKRLQPSGATYVYQNNNAVRIFKNKYNAEKYEAEVMEMLHDEQCSSASDDEWTVEIVMRRLMQKRDSSCI